MYSRNTANGRGRGIIPPYNYGGTVYSRALRDAQDSSRPQGMVRDEEARRAGSGAGTDVGSAQQNIGGVRTVRADSAHPVGTNGMNSVGRGIPDGAAVGVAAGRSAMQGMRRGVQPERQMGRTACRRLCGYGSVEYACCGSAAEGYSSCRRCLRKNRNARRRQTRRRLSSAQLPRCARARRQTDRRRSSSSGTARRSVRTAVAARPRRSARSVAAERRYSADIPARHTHVGAQRGQARGRSADSHYRAAAPRREMIPEAAGGN